MRIGELGAEAEAEITELMDSEPGSEDELLALAHLWRAGDPVGIASALSSAVREVVDGH